jgi:transcriptional regulator with XRE-family HTH domain
MRFGELVRHHRLQHGWSQSNLAERLGVTQRYVSRVESDEANNPTLETICAFALALELRFYELKPLFVCLITPHAIPRILELVADA